MKLILKIPVIICLALFATDIMAQNGRLVTTSHFGSFNYVDTYDESLNALGMILNTTDPLAISQSNADLKQLYFNMSGVSINDADLDAMMDFTQVNYDTWMAVLEDPNNNGSGIDTYVLRSIIMNIKKNL